MVNFKKSRFSVPSANKTQESEPLSLETHIESCLFLGLLKQVIQIHGQSYAAHL